ncbi:MAG TPA: hypothetical protein DCE78_00740 [Bacteroidetes bacterium]|nr:hypothetical protein [Bacteroidota bacterium]
MKILLRTILVLFLIILLSIVGLFLYLNDDRVRAMVVPQIEEALGREVQLDRVSFAIFRTFPNVGLVMEGFSIPEQDDTLASFRELVVSVKFWPLLDGNFEVNSLDLIGAQLAYVIFPDGSTNMDTFFEDADSTVTADTSTTRIDLNSITITDATIHYIDMQGDMSAVFRDLDAEMDIEIVDNIVVEMKSTLGGLSMTSAGTEYLTDLPLSLDQTFTLETENEVFTIAEGRFLIRGLALNLSGTIRDWSQENLMLDLQFASSSDNFGTLLELIPDEYQAELEGIDSRGALQLSGTVNGAYGDSLTPDFEVVLAVQDGFLKHPDAQKPIEDVQIDLTANNERVQINSFSAKADANTISLSGLITDPLDSKISTFDLITDALVDLSTVKEFYPISADTMELRGLFRFNGTAKGEIDAFENARVNGQLTLNDGYLRHSSFPHPIENIQLNSELTATEFKILKSSFISGTNTFESTGSIQDYMGEIPNLNLLIKTTLNLDEIEDYYSLEEYLIEVAGKMQADLTLRGPIDDFNKINFVGTTRFWDVSVLGDSLPAPITGVNGNLNFSNNQVDLSNYTMQMGDSDFAIDGRMTNWKNLFEEPGSVTPASLNATYKAKKLNIDEFVDWDEENTEPVLIKLPNLVSQLNINIDSVMIMGIPIGQITGQGSTDPKFIRTNNATAQLYGGKAVGNFVWEIYQPEYTFMHFVGGLENVRAEEFFKTFQMGGKSKIASYLSGGFNAKVDYKSGVGSNFTADATTIVANGTFGIDRARLRDHPTQKGISTLLKMPEFNDLSMDTWTANFTINNGVMSLTNMNLTSKDIGMTISGTQNLSTGELDYDLQLQLPERLGTRLAGILSTDAVNALKDDDGIIILPLAATGNVDNPRVSIDSEVVERIVTEYLRKRGTDKLEDAAKRLLEGIRGN